MKIFVACVLLAVVVAEPPVNNQYLPPQRSYSQPAQTYGVPGFGPQRQTDAIIRSRPSTTYGAPLSNQRINGRRPSNQYIPPNNQYSPPQRFNNQFSGATKQFTPLSNQYNPPSNQYIPPSNQYVPPSNQYIPPTSQRNANQYAPAQAPSNEYLPPQGSNFGRQNIPSSQYGAPALNANLLAPSQQYGAPGFEGNQLSGSYDALGNIGERGGYAGNDGSNEPANYSFEYKVKDEPSGNDFGHRESRQGDRAEGLYYVVLPDGRKQTVEYEADQNGYKPRISYEDTGLGAGGYNRNAQNAYDDQGPY